MTLDELQKNWKGYALIQPKGHIIPLKDAFMICWGPMNGGLLFDAGGQQGAPACILKPDENDGCWAKTDWEAPDGSAWKYIGKLVKLTDLDGERKKKPESSRKRSRKR